MLKEMREKAGLTQMQVAEALGYSSAQFISNWEAGKARPPLKTLPRLAKMYGVPAAKFRKMRLTEYENKLKAAGL